MTETQPHSSTTTPQGPAVVVPDKPALEGLEDVSHGALRPLYRAGSSSNRALQCAEQKKTVTSS